MEALVAAAAIGDRNAIGQVLGLIRPLVVRYCRGRIGGVERVQMSADDVAQEVCLAVMTALPHYRDQGRPFMAFVYGIAAHKVADAHRALARNRADPIADVPDSAAPGEGPEQLAVESETRRHMAELLSVLPPRHREILLLRLVVGLSAEETAEAIGSTAGSIRVTQHRALARLKAHLVETAHLAAALA